jgi:hypothetical protein
MHVHCRVVQNLRPARGKKLPSVPLAMTQIQIADLGHVTRQHGQRPRAHRKTLGIAVPVPICNAERTKQLFPRIILGELAGQPGNDRGGEIRIGAAFAPCRPQFPDPNQIRRSYPEGFES